MTSDDINRVLTQLEKAIDDVRKLPTFDADSARTWSDLQQASSGLKKLVALIESGKLKLDTST
jgi:hypothetical protein